MCAAKELQWDGHVTSLRLIVDSPIISLSSGVLIMILYFKWLCPADNFKMTYLSGKSLVESFEQTVSADNLSSSQVLLLLTVERFTVFVPCSPHSLYRFFLKFDIRAHKSTYRRGFLRPIYQFETSRNFQWERSDKTCLWIGTYIT